MNPQYAYQSAPANFMPMMMAGGGLTAAPQQKYGLASAAEELRSRGREGDTILAHINPQEAGILQLLGGSGTINPYTGLPEYRLKKLFKKIAAPVAAVIAAPLGPAASAAAYAAVAKSQGASDKQALIGATLAFTGASLANSGSTIATGADPFMSARDVSAFGLDAPVTATTIASEATKLGIAPGVGPGIAPPPLMSPTDAAQYFGTGAPGAETFAGIAPAAVAPAAAGAGAPAAASGPTVSSALNAIRSATTPTLTKNALNTALLGTLGYGAVTAAQETKEQRKLAEAELARQQEKIAEQRRFAETNLAANPFSFRRLNREDIERTGLGMPQNYLAEIPSTVSVASGGRINFEEDYDPTGVASLVKGGLPPRYLRGGGDGMSDSIPARIGGRQEARLADGEFVIPADVVSHIGNGSSNAGAKKLYAMMDRIRKARTGSTRQAPAVKTNRLMPA